MPIRIPQLDPATQSNSDDYFPISQWDGVKRVTLRITTNQIKSFITQDLSQSLQTLTNKINSGLTTKLSISGGETMTGYLTLFANPVNSNHAATKAYVDSAVASANTNTSSNYVPLAGGIMTGRLTLFADPVNDLHAVTKRYLDDVIGTLTQSTNNNFVNLANNNTMTGQLTLNNDPVNPLDASTKAYVDKRVLNLSAASDATYLHLSGGKMSGPLDMGKNKLSNFYSNIVTVNANTTLGDDHYGAVILVDGTINTTTTITVPTSLPVGFNCVLIQIGQGIITVNPSGTMTLVNVNGATSTTRRWSQMNLCVIQSDKVWISGDVI